MIDIQKIIDNLGIDVTLRGHEANGLCPMHGYRTGKEDNSPSWWINIETGMHICFSCGYKGNVLQLVADVNEFYYKGPDGKYLYDYTAARNWISSASSVSIEKLAEMLRSLPDRIEESPKPLEMSEARLAIYIDPPQDILESRGITLATAQKYNVLWDAKKKAWVLPLREPHFNKLMGWQEKGTIDRTFFNRPTGLQRSKTLFGIENQNESLAVIVESPLDVLRLDAAGVLGALATCGSSLSEEQIKLIRFSDKIVAAFDNDKAGLNASAEMLKFARKYGLNLFFFNYGSSGKKDPGDMTDEEIRWGIENAKSSIFGESAYVQGNAQTVSG
jgi:hypothetical protein